MLGFDAHQALFERSVELIIKLRHGEGLDENLYRSLLNDVLKTLESQKDSNVIDKGLAFIAFNTPYSMQNQLGIYDVPEKSDQYNVIEAASQKFLFEVEAYFDGFQ